MHTGRTIRISRPIQALLGFLVGIALGFAGLLWVKAHRSPSPRETLQDQVRTFTQTIEFDHTTWQLQALWLKFRYGTLDPERYLNIPGQREQVEAYLRVVEAIHRLEETQRQIYGDPNLSEAERAAKLNELEPQLQALYAQRSRLAPMAEEIIQAQVSVVLHDVGLTLGGQPIPPVLYHVSPLPWGLVVSPRDVIRRDAFVTLEPDLTVQEHIRLEDDIAHSLNVSTLVVPVGGVGTYPTMVMETTYLPWLIETVVHEWLHNFFDLFPLGRSYEDSPEMRTVNETAASLAGHAIGRMVLERFYPDQVPDPPPPPLPQEDDEEDEATMLAEEGEHHQPVPDPAGFDFNREMRRTRVRVDQLLAEGKIEEAEAYMEARRRVFWEHGYPIRKLNQAYFAFYGAYAATPGGAAGDDPVGEAVRELWALSPDPGTFVRRLLWIDSFEELQQLLETLRAQASQGAEP
ncbi:MAG: hypothetical protein GXO36_02840 [Chloroflexi bacterium]|nr:hypothetical protein [Chloroflexota bacterium]